MTSVIGVGRGGSNIAPNIGRYSVGQTTNLGRWFKNGQKTWDVINGRSQIEKNVKAHA
jgi:hypothetical protein